MAEQAYDFRKAGGLARERRRETRQALGEDAPVTLQVATPPAPEAGSSKVLCVKFCKGGHGSLESCGLAELDFLVLFEIVHIEIAVGFEPVLVGFDG